MRSSKSRSRSKGNRNRSVGNVINRVFDSSGPEGKVRGTPQQIIDKYSQLARDAYLANDRVAFENFQQHGEHYTRLLGAAQREMEERREQQEREQRERQTQQQQQQQNPRGDQADPADEARPDSVAGLEAADVAETQDSGLVETPEGKSQRRPRSRKPRSDQAQNGPDTPEAAE